MSLSLDEVRHVATLARLQMEDTELEELRNNLNSLLDHFNELQEVDASGVQPVTNAVNLVNVLAEDIVRPGLTREEALANAAATRAGLFVVPTIIEE